MRPTALVTVTPTLLLRLHGRPDEGRVGRGTRAAMQLHAHCRSESQWPSGQRSTRTQLTEPHRHHHHHHLTASSQHGLRGAPPAPFFSVQHRKGAASGFSGFSGSSGVSKAAATRTGGATARPDEGVAQAGAPAHASTSDAHPSGGSQRRAIVVGAGPAGCLAAMLLVQQGWKVDLYERRGFDATVGKNAKQRSWVVTMCERCATLRYLAQ